MAAHSAQESRGPGGHGPRRQDARQVVRTWRAPFYHELCPRAHAHQTWSWRGGDALIRFRNWFHDLKPPNLALPTHSVNPRAASMSWVHNLRHTKFDAVDALMQSTSRVHKLSTPNLDLATHSFGSRAGSASWAHELGPRAQPRRIWSWRRIHSVQEQSQRAWSTTSCTPSFELIICSFDPRPGSTRRVYELRHTKFGVGDGSTSSGPRAQAHKIES